MNMPNDDKLIKVGRLKSKIEDCGGIGGLERIQEIFEQGEGEEFESYCEWLGTSKIDFTKFNRTAINKKLAKEVAKIDKAYMEQI